MQNPDNCLTNAMFIASESYSGSSYTPISLGMIDSACDEVAAFLNENSSLATPTALAA